MNSVALLGASNLSLGLGVVVDLLRLHGPATIYCANGLGRSYGMPSMVLGRRLSGILQCGLWDAIDRQPAPAAALVTDIGNDLLYQVAPAQIAAWVDECVARLSARGTKIAVTRLPVCNLPRLGHARYYALRTLYYPWCRLRYDEILARAEELDRLVAQIASAHGATCVEPHERWYGVDAIHVRPRWWRRAWREILSPLDARLATNHFGGPPALADTAVSLLRSAAGLRYCPAERRVWGLKQCRAQPAIRLADGTTVSLY